MVSGHDVDIKRIHEQLVEGLKKPAAYPWPAQHVEFIETHISWVFLAGDRVLKIKRPVHYPFVDHRTLEARKTSCEQEVVLNRRLTTNVYLAVVTIVRNGDRISVGSDGEILEWGTLMRRLPGEGMLEDLILADNVPQGAGRQIGAAIRHFHDYAAAVCATDPASAAEQSAVVTDNLKEIRTSAGSMVSREQFRQIDMAVRTFIADQIPLLESRVTNGWIRDGHGDLRADHICIEPDGSLQIFDCIEFNAKLRCSDIASDLSFLLMDLRRLDRDDLAIEVLNGYDAGPKTLPPSIVRFYETHRALVRVKTECLTASQAGEQEHGAASETAVRFLDTAFRSSIHTESCMIVMTGLSGTGKSTVARRLAWPLRAAWLRSDEIRAGLGAEVAGDSGWLRGAYAPALTEQTYEQMFQQARQHLESGVPVLLDATFLEQSFRDRASMEAELAGVPAFLVETTCPEPVIRQRLDARAREGNDPSAATFETYLLQRQAALDADLTAPPGIRHVLVDTSIASATWLDEVYQQIDSLELFHSAL